MQRLATAVLQGEATRAALSLAASGSGSTDAAGSLWSELLGETWPATAPGRSPEHEARLAFEAAVTSTAAGSASTAAHTATALVAQGSTSMSVDAVSVAPATPSTPTGLGATALDTNDASEAASPPPRLPTATAAVVQTWLARHVAADGVPIQLLATAAELERLLQPHDAAAQYIAMTAVVEEAIVSRHDLEMELTHATRDQASTPKHAKKRARRRPAPTNLLGMGATATVAGDAKAEDKGAAGDGGAGSAGSQRDSAATVRLRLAVRNVQVLENAMPTVRSTRREERGE